MATIRAEAVDMIYSLTESEVMDAINYLKKLVKAKNAKSEEEERLEREMAYKRLEAAVQENAKLYGPDFDWKKEYVEALAEKYGIAN